MMSNKQTMQQILDCTIAPDYEEMGLKPQAQAVLVLENATEVLLQQAIAIGCTRTAADVVVLDGLQDEGIDYIALNFPELARVIRSALLDGFQHIILKGKDAAY